MRMRTLLTTKMVCAAFVIASLACLRVMSAEPKTPEGIQTSGNEEGGSLIRIKPGLTNWIPSRRSKHYSLDQAVTKVSDASIKLGEDSRVDQSIIMEPGASYRVSFYLRGENITGAGARMIIKSDSRWMRIVANQEGDYETGTFDWKKADTRIEIRPTESGNVKISFDLTGSGTVWFDGLKIEKVMD